MENRHNLIELNFFIVITNVISYNENIISLRRKK